MILALYRFLSPLAAALLPIFGRFSPKLAATLAWRRESGGIAGIRPKARPRIWMHAASAGELEQARPLLAEIRRRWPGAALLLTLSSASARKGAEELSGADLAFPLPADTPGRMTALLDSFRPDRILVVKWDLWPNLLMEARRRRVPVHLVGAVLAEESGRSRAPGRWLYRSLHAMLCGVAAASEADAAAFLRMGLAQERLAVTGDTRFDRVIARRDERRTHALSGADHPRESCLVAGSTWPAEEAFLLEVYPRILGDHPKARLLIVPHEPGEKALARLEAEAAEKELPAARLSGLADLPAGRVVLADKMGQLAELYRLGSLALVGGGFGSGVHSVLEAAAHGLPVLMGPRVERAAEARALVAAGAGRIIRDAGELESAWRRHLSDPRGREEAALRAREFVESGAGAAVRSLDFVEKAENFG